MKQYYLWIILGILSICQACSPVQKQSPLKSTEHISAWEFRQVGKQEWRSATVPGCVHSDLLKHELIEDPFYRLNEHDMQWIDKEDWEYRSYFDVSEELLSKEQCYLNFKGLDTYADVYLNDSLILTADNMFRAWEVDCKHLLKTKGNELRVYFHSPIKVGLDIYDNYPYVVQSSPNDLAKIGKVPGEKWVSPHVRKAPYHFGWDWGPRLVTSGIWEPVELVAWDKAQIKDVHTRQLSQNEDLATFKSSLEVEATEDGKAAIRLFVDEKLLKEESIDLKAGKHAYPITFSIENPELWWTNGLGEAHLYQVRAEIVTDQGIDSFSHTMGIRTLELVREKDKVGRSFYFKLNGQPVFMKGANYIPNDVFLDRVSPEKYEHIIKSAADCNFNMLRIWGGGIYEKEIFYELCDQYGILVWQDFMFACNMYPGDEGFLSSVRQEAEYNVKRLRNHPSIALWCGNNEILGAWFGWGWKTDNEKSQPEGAKAMWQAYKDIFLDVLPNEVIKHDPDRSYWASSPQAGDTLRTSNVDGDQHDWRIWFQDVPFITYHDGPARFVSEYGFQSFPELKSVKKYALPEDYDINSEVMKSHQRSFIGNPTIKRYMDNYYREPKDFESFLYTGLLLQAEGIKTGIEGHRINMPTTMGSLYWQLNDVWPVASWSSIDYYGNWKALQYYTRKAYSAIIAVPDTKTENLKIYTVSDKWEDLDAQLHLRLMDFEGKVLWEQQDDVKIKANTSHVVFERSLKTLLKGIDKRKVILHTQLKQGTEELYNTTSHFVEVKDLELPIPDVTFTVEQVEKGYAIDLKTDVLAKNLYLSLDGAEGWFTDNYFDLLPGAERRIVFETQEQLPELSNNLLLRTVRDTY